MKRKLLVLTALLSLCVLLAACKKSDDTISTPASTATSSAGPEATPEPTLPPYEANVLTGSSFVCINGDGSCSAYGCHS